MNVVKKLTLRHLSENKGRTVITLLGICVSVAMITAVFTAIASFASFFGEVSLFQCGDWHFSSEQLSDETVNKITNDSRVDSAARLKTAYDYTFEITGGNNKTDTQSCAVCDSVYFERMISNAFEGKIPTEPGEAAVEGKYIKKYALDWKIGDTVTLPTGFAKATDDAGKPYVFEKTGERTFTITAILDNNMPTSEYPILILGSEEEMSSGQITAFFKLSKEDRSAQKTVASIASDYSLQSHDTNTELLASYLAFGDGGYLSQIIIPVILLLILIIIASVLLIYNAFSMSLNERVRYLGMLASVGATKRQKRASIYFEGFILGIIGIPVGTLAGIAGIAVTFYALSDKIVSSGMLPGIENSSLKIGVSVPAWAIVMIVIFSILTIWISTLIPAKKASVITPIDAIKQTDSIKIKKQKYTCPKLVSKLFGFEGEISYKSLKRNSRKTKMITASITLSLILFLCTNYFCTLLVDSNQYSSVMPYQLTVYCDAVDYDTVKDIVLSVNGVDDVFSATWHSTAIGGKKEEANKDYANITDDASVLTVQNQQYFDSTKIFGYNIIDDGRFNQLCVENGIDREAFYTGAVKCLILNNLTHSSTGTELFTDNIIGKTFKAHTNYADIDTVVGGLIKYDKNSAMCNLNYKGCISAYIPLSRYLEETEKNDNPDLGIVNLTMGVVTKTHAATAEAIKNAFIAAGYANSDNVYDLDESQQVINTLIYVLQVFIYGFITLMTLITIANILNTVSTGVILRRKEFAMLRSVGMTPKGFRKMIIMESVFYGLKSLIIGIPVSLLINFALNRSLGSAYVPFNIDITAYLAACLGVFVITGISMLYSVGKIKKDSIIETLKEEIN